MTPSMFMTVLLLVTSVSTALCGPLGKRKDHPRKDDPPYTETKGISPELFDQLQLMLQYSAAAYWPRNVNSVGDRLSCSLDHCDKLPKSNCPRVEAANASTVDEFKPPGGHDNGRDL